MGIAIGQMEITACDLRKNKQSILSMIASAKKEGADLLILPELAVSGLIIGDYHLRRDYVDDCRAFGEEIAALATDIVVVFGNIEKRDGKIYNSVFMGMDGQLGRLEAPMGESFIHGAYSAFAEYLEAKPYNIEIDGKIFRTGFLIGDWRNKKLPFSANDVDLLVNMAAEPLLLDDNEKQVPIAGRPFIRVNCCGLAGQGKYNYLYRGGSYMLDVQGNTTHSLPRLQRKFGVFEKNTPRISQDIGEDELLTEALVTGVRSFCRQISVNHAVIGISGGIDSALAACIYSRALMPENVMLINMPSKYNSNTTHDLAERMAGALHTNYFNMPIQNQVDAMCGMFSQTIGRDAHGGEINLAIQGLALENLQARERARILAAAASAWQGIFTCNGNKSELAVGYATFYGDLAGAFAACSDLWKYQVYQAAKQMQTIFSDAPLAEIAAIRPSAELSLQQDVDKGLGDPLRYDYHDYLLKAWVEKDMGPADILRYYQRGELAQAIGCDDKVLKSLFTSNSAFVADTEYWWRMYKGIGVAKRYQAPPMLVLSKRPLGIPVGETQAAAYFSEGFFSLKNELINAK